MTKPEAYDLMVNSFGYPETVARDLCNYFNSVLLAEFINFLQGEY